MRGHASSNRAGGIDRAKVADDTRPRTSFMLGEGGKHSGRRAGADTPEPKTRAETTFEGHRARSKKPKNQKRKS